MTLRARLLITVGVLVAVALIGTGALVVGLTRSALIQQLDADLNEAFQAELNLGTDNGQVDPTGRRFALLVYDRSGDLIREIPSGQTDHPDPLPQLPAGGATAVPVDRILELTARDGSQDYRVLARIGRLRIAGGPGPQGVPVIAVLGAPMAGVDRSMSVLVSALLVVGAVVLLASLVVGWFIIRRDLRPLEAMTGTAERISAGDLSSRVGVRDDGSEVGRLGHAFDTMLDQIQASFGAQQAALAAKEKSETQLRQFVADASHELRTPLTAVRGYAELYRAGGLAEEPALEQAMSRIGTESRRMAALVEDLLLLARLDQGRPLRQDPVVLSDLVHDAVSDVRAVEPDREVRESVEEGVVVQGDEDRLRQVIGNLFANVRVHTPASAAVDVVLSARDGVASLAVADHGPGVDPDHVEHIFDRFYRADTGRSRDRGGSGLGLAIATSVAGAHGGTISHAPTPGGGATFTLTLPRT
jgi:two-component system OmpR family sensor kinase